MNTNSMVISYWLWCLIKVSQRSVYINNCGNVSALLLLKNGSKHSAEWLWYCTIKSFPRFTPYLIRGQLSLLGVRHQVIPQRIDICFPMDWPAKALWIFRTIISPLFEEKWCPLFSNSESQTIREIASLVEKLQ